MPNQTANNKENSKKTNESISGGATSHGVGKVALKPREFGREITNAATGSAMAVGANNTHQSKQPT